MEIFRGEKKEISEQERMVRYLKVRRRWGVFFRDLRMRQAREPSEIDTLAGLPPGTYQTWEAGFRLPEAALLGQISPLLDAAGQLEFEKISYEIRLEAHLYRMERDFPLIS